MKTPTMKVDIDYNKHHLAKSLGTFQMLSSYKNGEMYLQIDSPAIKRLNVFDGLVEIVSAIEKCSKNSVFTYRVIMEYRLPEGISITLPERTEYGNVEYLTTTNGVSVVRAQVTDKYPDGYSLELNEPFVYIHSLAQSYYRHSRNIMRLFCGHCRSAVKRARSQ